MSADGPELLGPPPPPPPVQLQHRPWDYDTEDSGVDSVSSFVGLETDRPVEYAQVMLPGSSAAGQKSFLHNVYNNNDAEVLQCYDDVSSCTSRTLPAIETAKNCFLHSLLEEQDESETPPTPPPTASTKKLALLPELVQLLDAEGGTIELVGKDGTRASLRVTLVPPAGQEQSTRAGSKPSTFSRVQHRNSVKRSSQRRSNKGNGPELTGGVRRRPSNSKRGAAVGATATPSHTKVATLASKFNSLISESRRGPAASGPPVADKNRSLSPAARRTTARNVQQQTGKSSTAAVKRNPSAKPRIDTIPEMDSLPDGGADQPRRKSHQSDQDPSGSGSKGQSVYGTVKSIVKQAIRKFEKLDGPDPAAAAAAPPQEQPADPPPPEGIAPNSSFLWRDHRTTQSLIYEATAFNERSRSESGGYYDSLRRNSYDTLQHKSSSSSSSSSTGGYDEIQAPKESSANPSEGSVRYDDIVKPGGGATYDELSFRRRPSNGYDELQSPPSTTSSGGYIDPGSSSALGYERILPPKQSSSDEDGSTLRYEECGSAPPPSIVKAVPVAVKESQLDSISYLYDDIRSGGGGYGGSHHSYEPIYAHLGAASISAGYKSSDTLSGKRRPALI